MRNKKYKTAQSRVNIWIGGFSDMCFLDTVDTIILWIRQSFSEQGIVNIKHTSSTEILADEIL